MSDDPAVNKAELRKARKEAKKEVKQKAVSKAVANAEQTADADSPSQQKPPKAPKQPPKQPAATTAAAASTTTSTDTTATSAPANTNTTTSSSTSMTTTAKTTSSQPAKAPSAQQQQPSTQPQQQIHMFMSNFSDDWTSGAVPLLAALQRLVVSISQQDDHDCSLAAAAIKSKDNDCGSELLRHFDEAHLRPFLAYRLGLTASLGNGETATSKAAQPAVTKKAMLCVGHLAAIKWVRELVFAQRISSASSQSQQQPKPAMGVIDFLTSLSESLVDIYIERIQLAADGVCRFGSEILASCTTSRPISPAFPICFSQPIASFSFPSSLIVTLASCSCCRGPAGQQQQQQQNFNRRPTISHLVSRSLALTAAKCDNQRDLEADLNNSSEDSNEGVGQRLPPQQSSTDDSSSSFHPPCLTVAVATPGCCSVSQQYQNRLFDDGELGTSPSLVVFPVPLSRLGSAIAAGSVSAVVLPANAILANRGSAVLAPKGSGLLALAARAQWHCPVIVLAETYKIIAGGQEEIEESLKGLAPGKSASSVSSAELYMDDADLISAEHISVVVTELGAVPAAALPSILRLSQKARPARATARSQSIMEPRASFDLDVPSL